MLHSEIALLNTELIHITNDVELTMTWTAVDLNILNITVLTVYLT